MQEVKTGSRRTKKSFTAGNTHNFSCSDSLLDSSCQAVYIRHLRLKQAINCVIKLTFYSFSARSLCHNASLFNRFGFEIKAVCSLSDTAYDIVNYRENNMR